MLDSTVHHALSLALLPAALACAACVPADDSDADTQADEAAQSDTGAGTDSSSDSDTGPDSGSDTSSDTGSDSDSSSDTSSESGDRPEPSLIHVVAGDRMACALLEDGVVRCWGLNQFGKLGHASDETIGDDEPASAGPDLDLGGPVVQLALGAEHGCALLDTGAVRCWGHGQDGRLGYGNQHDIGDGEVPAAAGDVDVGGPAIQVAVGNRHSCAILQGGAVRCWGFGSSGQLGYGNVEDIGDDEPPSSAGDVDVGGAVVQLSAGAAHTCALLDTGAVRCWGIGGSGRLGYVSHDNIGDDELPSSAGDVDVGGPVAAISVGQGHTCALLESGGVRCWGLAYKGQLGHGNMNPLGDDEAPATAGDIPIGGLAVAIAAGGNHVCALLESGGLRCWGEAGHGALGYGDTFYHGLMSYPSDAGDVDVGGTIVQIAAGRDQSCAMLAGGTLRCWGYGLTGGLGYGNTETIGDDETPNSAGDVPFQ